MGNCLQSAPYRRRHYRLAKRISMESKCATCNHLHDDGGTCNSAAVTGQKYCIYHLRYRARQLRRAQLRARGERFGIKLPPLESMFAVQSALTQLGEALAADMIDPKRAQQLLSVLRLASRNLLHSDKWQPSVYHTEVSGPAIDLAAEYGLPRDLDLDTPPERAFPQSVILREERSDESKDPFISAYRTGEGVFPDSPMPTVAYCKDGPGCPEHTIRADFPVTPANVEVYEVFQTLGSDAAAIRGGQLERNRQRRQLHSDRKRFAAIALQKNLRLAADRLAEQKLAEKDVQDKLAAGCPTPAAVAGVGVFAPDTNAVGSQFVASDEQDAASNKKRPASISIETGETFAPKEAATA